MVDSNRNYFRKRAAQEAEQAERAAHPAAATAHSRLAAAYHAQAQSADPSAGEDLA